MANFKEELISIRRHLHQYPELGFKEYKTSKFIANYLRKLGIEVKTGIAQTGVIGILKPPTANRQLPTKCIALRADMDALPVKEETKKPYASKNKGVMHACGHDGNMTCVLGAAKILSQKKNQLKGIVKFIFQPSEELASGAEIMIKEGTLINPSVNAIIGLHMNPALEVGKIGIKYGQMMAAVDEFILTIIGEGGHGATPHQGIDAIAVSGEVISALQHIVSRKTDPLEPVVVSIGTIHGGSQFNIIADRVTMTGTVRTLNEKTHRRIPKIFEQIVKGVTQGMQAKYELDYKVIGVSLKNSKNIVDLVKKASIQLIGKNNVIEEAKPSMGGEDFANYLQKVPGAFIYLGVGNPRQDIIYPWHHAKFDIDEKALSLGAEVLAQVVMKYL